MAGIGKVGEHQGVRAEADRVVTHLFACLDPAYRGWMWGVTVARASRSKLVTVDETVLLPGDDALLAPAWVPWSERLRPGDLGAGDILPTPVDDIRLVPGYTGAESYPPPVTATEVAEPSAKAGAGAGHAVIVTKDGDGDAVGGQLPLVAFDLGIDRPRVLSLQGRRAAAERWYAGDGGPDNAMTRQAPAHCVTCGFLVPLGKPWAQAFGVCANEFSPSDGKVVSLDHGCGAHSEAPFIPAPSPPVVPIVDEFLVEPIAWEPMETADEHGSVESTAPAEELGHA